MILIIGYGSTLRSDDGIGLLVAERLIDEFHDQAQVQVIARQLLTPDLADEVSRAERVLFVDACVQTPPGEIDRRPVTPGGENWGAFVHEMSPAVLLDCVKELYGKTPAAELITIGGKCFDIGEGLSPEVQAALPRVLEMIRSECTAA